MTDQTPAPATPATPTLPLFYRAPTLLRFADHAGFGLRRAADYAVAAGATAIPLVAAEFALAGRHYPIVFASDASAMPLAVTGVSVGRNLFVSTEGQWATGRYIPSYVRRYPFIGMALEDGGTTMLGIDAASPRISTDAARDDADLLFTPDGKATPTGEAAMALCDAYAIEHERTVAFATALKAHNLLVERSAEMRYADATQALVQGFRLIDEPAVRALPAAVVTEFHAKGWLDAITLHLASQLSWQNLVEASAPNVG